MNQRIRVFIVLASYIAYAAIFPLVYNSVGAAAGILSTAPVIVTALLFGLRAGLVSGLLTLPLNYVLYEWVADSQPNNVSSRLLGTGAAIVVGAVIGFRKTLIDRIRHQSQELMRQHHALEEQIVKREQIEQALRKAKEDLEIKVEERTVKLRDANIQLQLELAERKKVEEERQEYVAQLESIRQMSLEITAELEQESVLLSIAERALKLIGGITSSFYLYNPERDLLERVIKAGPYLVASAMTRKRGEGLIGKVWESGKPMFVNDYRQWDKRNSAYDDAPSRNVMGVPLFWGTQFLGVATIIAEHSNPFSQADVDLMSLFTSHASVAIHNAQLYQTAQQEIAERKRTQEQLLHDAFHDSLTGLPNRALFMDRLGRAVERAKRSKENCFAVLYLDFDRFKVVNDSLGHAIGDQLLIESARRLDRCIRSIDTVARLGGDEFVFLIEDVSEENEAVRVADRIRADLAVPFNLDGYRVFNSASIGIVCNVSGYVWPADILRDADVAMYHAKILGKARYELFEPAMRERAVARLEIETDLRGAIERNEFQLYYQPILSLKTGHLTGFEALLRWQHPTRGLILPNQFISIAEETGLIVRIGEWVLREACRQTLEWQTRLAMDPPLTISVNLSARQFSESDFIPQIARILKETGLDAGNLKLEITESVIVDDAGSTRDKLSRLRDLGVEVQIDDFGTGYSALGYLQRLPIDALKIDRSFIGRIGVNGNGIEIVRTILALAHDLGLKAIAEGVETSEQLTKLQDLECEYGQGYLFAKPIDSQAANALIAQSFEGNWQTLPQAG